MARKKEITQLPADMPELLPGKAAELVLNQDEFALVTAQHDSAVRAVALQMGYQLPADCTDPDLIQRDITVNLHRSVQSVLEAGKGLRVLKMACAHGNFMARLDVMSVDPHVAARFMQAAGKFSKLPTSATLKAVGNQSKLFEMLILDDDQIEELELTGQTGELKLDDVAIMSVKELRAAVREARAEKDATEKLLATKDAKINKLSRHIAKATPEERVEQDLAETTTRAHTALAYVRGDLRLAFETLAAHEQGGNTSHRGVMAGIVADLRRALDILQSDFFLGEVQS